MNPKIKNIYIQVPFYDFSCKDSDIFIGRKSAKKNLIRRLIPSNNKNLPYHGAYLVAGFRGMGKTKLVSQAIEEINSSEIKPLYIYLSQNTVNDYDLLRQIFIEFNNYIEDNKKPKWDEIIYGYTSKIAIIIFTFLAAYLLFRFKYIQQIEESNILVVLIFAIIFIQLAGFLNVSTNMITEKDNTKFQNKRMYINKRLFSSLEVSQNGNKKGFDGLGDGSPILDKVVSSIQDVFQDGKQTFDKLTAKELEIEIKELLRLHSKVKGSKKIIFVVDELDKIEPEYVEGSSQFFELGKSRLESRKEAVVSILASLKSFIHTSNAKYVFIGGAEMYDASLADVADRESFYSSIFNEVIYVDTFFKDQYTKTKKGVTEMVETYLARVLMFEYSSDITLENVIEKFHFVSNEEKWKYFITYLLYNFTVYLTYRCNGSPKKLKELIEYYLVEDFKISKGDDMVFVYTDNNNSCCYDKNYFLDPIVNRQYKWHINSSKNDNIHNQKQIYLKIHHRQLYKISLLTSLFKPYFINNQKFLKIRNDRNLYLTAFLMDHILKFHRSAFSWRELELIPDIIMGTKSPDIRESLISIVENLSITHIRETSNAMFQFKFRSRTSMELRYISKISDESSAAYNFSFDESHHLKSFFKRKLKQKIELFKDNKSISNDTSFIHSIADINATIADIHYYDDDYEPAIRYYADSVQPLRDLVQQKKQLNPHQEMIYTRNRLLLTLCLEKAFRYDSAYSVVRNIITDLKLINFSDRASEIINESKFTPVQTINLKNNLNEWESPYKRMQMFLRPYLTLLMIIEKERSDGITESNLSRNIQEYTKFLGLKDIFPTKNFNSALTYKDFSEDNKKSDNKRIHTLLADYYQNVGSILFYKNRNFKSIFEDGAHGILNNYLDLKDLKTGSPNKSITLNKKTFDGKHYYFISNIKECLDIGDKSFYPSYTAFFYYIIAFGHIVSPYLDNINSIFDLKNKIIDGQIFRILFRFNDTKNTQHILNGKVKEQLGLILCKIADSILGSLHDAKLDDTFLKDEFSQNTSFDKILENIKWDTENLKFNDLFSTQGFIYFTIQSYYFYTYAGKDYDALFQLKKILYFIKSHKPCLRENDNISQIKYHQAIIIFSHMIADRAFEILKHSDLCICESKANIYNTYITDFSKEADYLIESTDKTEICLLIHNINYNANQKIYPIPFKVDNLPTIRSIFLRIQILRFYIDKYLTTEFVESLPNFDPNHSCLLTLQSYLTQRLVIDRKTLQNLLFCFKALNEIINTYGFTYIMSYSYYASLLDKVLKLSMKIKVDYPSLAKCFKRYKSSLNPSQENNLNNLKELYIEINKEMNSKEMKKLAIINYQKAMRLHSEGKEYKLIIKNMYILDDDFNDTLVHFSAALERSLINNGRIEDRIERLIKLDIN